MKRIIPQCVLACLIATASLHAQNAGPFPDVLTGVNAAAIAANAWATGATNVAAPDGSGGFGQLSNVRGPADSPSDSSQSSAVFSLGNGGSVTVTFGAAIFDGPGSDFAIFENVFDFFGNPQTVDNTGPTRLTTGSFSGQFNASYLELGFVAVSSDGVNFVTFPSDDRTDVSGKYYDGFGRGFLGLDATDISGLAGRNVDHPFASITDSIGTPFDLSALVSDPLVIGGLVNLNAINFVRITDVVGDGSTRDSFNRPILDVFGDSGTGIGFDLDAVGAIHQVPEPASWLLVLAGVACAGLRRRHRS